MSSIKPNFAFQALLAISCSYFLIMVLLGIDRHWSFKTSIYDTGVYDQVIWNYIHESIPASSIGKIAMPYNWLGIHFNPILLFLFVPLYKLYPSPEWLILAQSFAIVSTTLPLYKTALRLNYSDWQAFLGSLAFLLNPFVISAIQWDFHPVAIATPVIAWSIYFLLIDDFKKLLLSIIILLLIQEQFGIVVICLGLTYYITYRRPKKSLFIVGIGVIYTFVLFQYVFPALSPTGSHVMLSSEFKTISRYNWLGGSIIEVFIHCFSSPLTIFKKMLIEMEGYRYIILLLLPYGMIFPCLGIEILLIGLADFAINALSLLEMQRSILSYHSVTLIPIIIIAAMIGYKRFIKFSPTMLCRMAIVATASAFFILFMISFPVLLGKNSVWILSPFPVKNPELSKIKKLIPENAALSVQVNIGPHFSQRKFLYSYPYNINTVDYILLRIEDPNGLLKDNSFRFIKHNGMDQKNYLTSIKCLLGSGKFRIEYFNPPWLILNKSSAPSDNYKDSSVINYLKVLEKRWEVENIKLNQNSCNWTKWTQQML
ncbi:MAG: DUF2079 domain-containing protein [Methylomicrobium sp.]